MTAALSATLFVGVFPVGPSASAQAGTSPAPVTVPEVPQQTPEVPKLSPEAGTPKEALPPVEGQLPQDPNLVAPPAPLVPEQQPNAPLATAPQWDAAKAYSAGQIVSYASKLYKAKWWTQGDKPDKPVTNPWESPWEFVGNDSGPGPVDTTPPTAPTGLVSTAQSDVTITLSWGAATDNVGVKQYDVFRNGAKVGTTAELTYKDSGLQKLTSYEYVVKAVDAAGNTTASAAITAKTSDGPSIGDDLKVGQSRVLNDVQIQSLWQGIDPQYGPDKAVAAVQSALPKAEYEAYFPMRLGSTAWHAFAKDKNYYAKKSTLGDYFSYDNLISAVRDISNIKYKVVHRVLPNSNSEFNKQIYRLDKATKTETLVYEEQDFNAEWNRNKPIKAKIVDFGTFLKEGTDKDRKRELAGFLANISHETGGGTAGTPSFLTWGLYWNEEINYINGGIGYVDGANKDYPAVPGKSYHGRGAIQLSWNYNYGLTSSIIYGDKNVLLQAPEKIERDGRLGFMSSILFWMTPQWPKPSAHDIMVGNYVPTPEQSAKGLVPGFGATIMVINGALEGNKGEDDYRIARRVGHYRDLTNKSGVNISGEKLDTLGMQPF
ncbi:chitinase [Paenibacillus sp. 481]|nr:chitinase [Paenibacillus sp. 481]